MTDLIHNIPERLFLAIQQHKCVPFVGAGLSLPYGIPRWHDLLMAMYDQCVREKVANPDIVNAQIAEGDFLEAAQKAKDKLGKKLFKDILTERIRVDTRNLPLTHQKLLWKISPKLIFTTNFDTLIEDVLNPRPEIITHLHKSKLAEFISGEIQNPVLFKLHGTINEFETVVLTKEDYENLYQKDINAYKLTFDTVLLQNTFLFIGFPFRRKRLRRF